MSSRAQVCLWRRLYTRSFPSHGVRVLLVPTGSRTWPFACCLRKYAASLASLLAQGDLPQQVKRAFIVTIAKRGKDPTLRKKQRGIALPCTVVKQAEAGFMQFASKWLGKWDDDVAVRFGAIAGRSTLEICAMLRCAIDAADAGFGPHFFILGADKKACFDEEPHWKCLGWPCPLAVETLLRGRQLVPLQDLIATGIVLPRAGEPALSYNAVRQVLHLPRNSPLCTFTASTGWVGGEWTLPRWHGH